MKRLSLLALLLFFALVAAATAQTTYYMTTGGSDSNSGTSGSPWASPNHALNCGDVIQAAAGTYSASNFQSGKWGTVTCPAGNSVAWLKCATFDACYISAGSNYGMYVDHSYWGVTGWEVTSTSSGYTCFAAAPPSSSPSANISHIIFANDVANGCGGGGLGTFASGSYSVDYIAIVGNIAYNSAQNSLNCYSGFSIYKPSATDSLAGTHIFIAGNFSYGNVDPSTCASSPSTDGDGIILDTFNGFAYCQQAVVENNIMVANGGHGFEKQGYVTNPSCAALTYVNSNTIWGDLSAIAASTNLCDEWVINEDYSVTGTKNIVQPDTATGCSGHTVVIMGAYNTSGTASGARPASAVAGNWIGLYTGATNTYVYNSDGNSFTFGSNTTGTSPSFANAVAPGAPSCGSAANVPACMATVIADFTPSGGAIGYGYQTPSSGAAFDPLFPQWLCNTNLPAGLIPTGCTTQFSLSTTASSITPAPYPPVNRHCCGDDWSEIETSRGTYTWTAFDAWQTATAAHAGSVNMYTFRSVPTWASGSTHAAPPTDVTTSCTFQAPLSGSGYDCMFQEFVTSYMQHLCGVSSQPSIPLTGACHMTYTNLWNEFNTSGYWTGTAAQLAQMSLDASAIIRAYCGDCFIVAASTSAGGVGGGGSISGDYDVALLAYLTAWGGLSGFVKPDYIDFHAYPSRDNIAPVPFPTTIQSNSSASCPNTTPSVYCYISIFQEVAQIKGSAVLGNSAISSWASGIPVMSTEGGWGTLIGVCDGSSCDYTTDANVSTLRKAYIGEWMLGLWQQGLAQALWYEYGNDACWGILYGPGSNSGCSSSPALPSGALPWLSALTQTQTWIAGCTSPGSWTETAVTGGNTWTLNATCGGNAAQFAFFDGWLTSYSMSTSYANYTTLDGTVHSASGSAPLTQMPVLLTNHMIPAVLSTPILMGKVVISATVGAPCFGDDTICISYSPRIGRQHNCESGSGRISLDQGIPIRACHKIARQNRTPSSGVEFLRRHRGILPSPTPEI
jgi:hypothetical protein